MSDAIQILQDHVIDHLPPIDDATSAPASDADGAAGPGSSNERLVTRDAGVCQFVHQFDAFVSGTIQSLTTAVRDALAHNRPPKSVAGISRAQLHVTITGMLQSMLTTQLTTDVVTSSNLRLAIAELCWAVRTALLYFSLCCVCV